MDIDNKLVVILEQFDLQGDFTEVKAFGNGHINDTYKVEVRNGSEVSRFVLQRINRSIFPRPEEVMQNIILVTDHIRNKVIAEGGDPKRQAMTVILTKDGKTGVYDADGEFWRLVSFIEGAVCFESAEDPELFYESGVAFGHFQHELSDFDASKLKEVLPDFHNTKKRFADFKECVEQDRAGRLASVKEDVDWLLENESIASVLVDRLEDGRLPLRVTHNDTKLNNIMMDPVTRKGVCVIDLDTVMPGLSATDFGDSIRFGANTGSEDEKDLSKISLDLELYRLYKKGFQEGCEGSLTDEEVEMLPWGALVITYEQALRFLGDYLNGDTYYKVEYPEHNLVRARTQIALAKDMILKFEEMKR